MSSGFIWITIRHYQFQQKLVSLDAAVFSCSLPWHKLNELINGFLESSYLLQLGSVQATKCLLSCGIILAPPWEDQGSLIQALYYRWDCVWEHSPMGTLMPGWIMQHPPASAMDSDTPTSTKNNVLSMMIKAGKKKVEKILVKSLFLG